MSKTLMRKSMPLQVVLTIMLFGLSAVAMPSIPNGQALPLADQVRHQLLMLPYYGVFDNLTFTIENQNTVVLSGQVLQSVLKPDAEAAVRSIEGVEKVINNIEVLPLSRFDNRIRWATYWAIYSKPGFEKYAIQAIPPIKIIVKNGHVTLDGVVGNQMDKTIATLAAKSIPNVFSVTDNLRVG